MIWKRKTKYTQEHVDHLKELAAEEMELAFKQGFDNGYSEGYNAGRADGIQHAKEAAKLAIQRRNQHGKETKPRTEDSREPRSS